MFAFDIFCRFNMGYWTGWLTWDTGRVSLFFEDHKQFVLGKSLSLLLNFAEREVPVLIDISTIVHLHFNILITSSSVYNLKLYNYMGDHLT